MNLSFFRRLLKNKPLRMVWTIEKGEQVAYLVGTAHFFPYSFSRSLTRLLQKVETAIFEGPLDEASMNRIAEWGHGGNSSPPLADLLEPEAVREINRQLGKRLARQPEEELYLLLQPTPPNYLELYSQGVRPWMAFFSIWTTYLGWPYSVDMEGYRIAQKLDKKICFLETIDEQLDVLDGIPLERIVSQLNGIKQWKSYAERHVDAFLAGDIEALLALMGRVPTRSPNVVGHRDVILYERMKAIFDRETAVAFVGAPHIPGVSTMFLEAGYTLTQGVK